MGQRAFSHDLKPIDIARANWPTNCSHCGASSVRVLETRPNGKAIRRRKHCEACGQRETTYEISQAQFKELEVLAKLRQVLMESNGHKPAPISQARRKKPAGTAELSEPSCSRCIHWADEVCSMEFPEAGGGFAAECSCFIGLRC